MDKKMKIFIGIVVVLIIILGIVLGIKINNKDNNVEEIAVEEPEEVETKEPVKEEKNIKIFNRKCKTNCFYDR